MIEVPLDMVGTAFKCAKSRQWQARNSVLQRRVAMDKIEFTKDEQYIVAYFRHSHPANSESFNFLYYFVPSLIMAAMAFREDSAAWAFVAYGLMVVYSGVRAFSGQRYVGTFTSVIAKYEGRIEALEKELANRDGKSGM